MVYQCLKNYFETIVKTKNFELTEQEKNSFHTFAQFNPYDKKSTHCYLCEFPFDCKQLNSPDLHTRECSRLDFVIRKEYQFLKNILTLTEIRESVHLSSLENYYKAMTFLLKAYEFISKQAEY